MRELKERPKHPRSSIETGGIGSMDRSHFLDTRSSCMWKSTKCIAGTPLPL